MPSYSYEVTAATPLSAADAANDDKRYAAYQATKDATAALAQSTFGSSWTDTGSVGFFKDGFYRTSTTITSPSEVSAASLPPGIAPVAGAENRLIEVQTPATTADTPLSPITPVAITSTPVVPEVVVATPPPTIVATTPAAEPVPVIPPPAPLVFEPLTVGGRILAPAEFAGAADTLVINPPTTTPEPVVGDPAYGGATNTEQAAINDALAVPPSVPNDATQEEQDALLAAIEANKVKTTAPADVPPSQVGYPNGLPYDDSGFLNPGWSLDENNNPVYVGPGFVEPATQASADASRTAAKAINAQKQSTLQARINQPSAADWRVRLQLADGSNYLYNEPVAANRGILAPLYDTAGVVFPYTPSIETNYKAKYTPYDLVHSNYRGYFYQNSSVDEISIKGTFTAQDTTEAQYLLAVIHFFRSVTKMFYGQGANVGTPPPLVFLSGLGQYQFNKHPCVVSSFNYSLPTDVDYIRADGFNNIGVNLENRRSLGSGPAMGGALGTIQRLLTNKLFTGAEKSSPWPSAVNQNVSNKTTLNSTYVPTKMEISIQLLPIQTRNQVSQQFSLQGFANGKLLTQGFW